MRNVSKNIYSRVRFSKTLTETITFKNFKHGLCEWKILYY